MTSIKAEDVDLAPCPFCGNELKRRASCNPYAICITPDCFGKKLPAVNLDVPSDVAAYNTRAQAARIVEL